MQTKLPFLLIILLFIAASSLAQTQFAGWFASFNTFKITEKTSIHFDGQVRSNDQLKNVSTILLRGGLNVHFKKNIIGTAGYAYISNRRILGNVHGYSPEHRIWEQLMVSHHIGFIPVSHRFRLEQRFISKSFISNGELKNEGNLYANRLRYFNRAIIAFNGEKNFAQGVFAALQNEVFFNFGDKSAVNGKVFDQNRAYIALGYRLSKKLDLETGYINQYISGRGRDFTNNHIVQVAGYIRI